MVKRLGGLNNSAIFNAVKTEVVNYDRYEANQLKVIGVCNRQSTDSIVSDHFSFAQWVNQHTNYPVIKVEGLEQSPFLMRAFKHFQPVDIHLFVSQHSGYSFKWHTDSVNVFLYVVKGQKIVYIKNKVHIVNAKSGIFIQKGHLHKVYSRAGTWALSIGFK